MRRKPLNGGPCVSMLGIGCARIGSISNSVAPAEVEATLEAAVDAGVNLFDTADIYGQGDSERTLGRLLRRHPGRLFVVTKVGGRHARFTRLVRLAKPALRSLARHRAGLKRSMIAARTASVVHDFAPADLDAAVDGSRRRLRLDQLHGLLLHNPSVDTLRNPAIHEFLAGLLNGGRALRVGVSVDTVAALEAALALPTVTMAQIPNRMASALIGSPLLDHLRERGTAIFVREVLKDDGLAGGRSAGDALARAIAPDFVAAAIVGISTRQHLSALLPSLA